MYTANPYACIDLLFHLKVLLQKGTFAMNYYIIGGSLPHQIEFLDSYLKGHCHGNFAIFWSKPLKYFTKSLFFNMKLLIQHGKKILKFSCRKNKL